MIVQFATNNFELTTELEKYARTKISQLIRKMPRRLRFGAACSIAFSQTRKKGTKFNTCTISIILGETLLKAEETTLHMYSSVDVAAVHVGNQLKDYAAKQGKRTIRRMLRASIGHPAR